MIKKSLYDVSVSDGINGGYVDLVEIFVDWSPVGLELLIPRSPFVFFLVEIMLVDSIGVWEHGFDISENVINLSS